MSDDAVRFVQTVGGRAGFPAPRRVSGKPFFRINSATAWTTLALTIRADGSVGARARRREPVPAALDLRPRRQARPESGDDRLQDVVPRVARRPNALGRGGFGSVRDRGRERARAAAVARAHVGRVAETAEGRSGETLVTQGETGDELFLLLDGVLVVEIDGEEVVELGPGAIVGELGALERSKRTATLRARTPVRVGVVPSDAVDRAKLEELASGRRR